MSRGVAAGGGELARIIKFVIVRVGQGYKALKMSIVVCTVSVCMFECCHQVFGLVTNAAPVQFLQTEYSLRNTP